MISKSQFIIFSALLASQGQVFAAFPAGADTPNKEETSAQPAANMDAPAAAIKEKAAPPAGSPLPAGAPETESLKKPAPPTQVAGASQAGDPAPEAVATSTNQQAASAGPTTSAQQAAAQQTPAPVVAAAPQAVAGQTTHVVTTTPAAQQTTTPAPVVAGAAQAVDDKTNTNTPVGTVAPATANDSTTTVAPKADSVQTTLTTTVTETKQTTPTASAESTTPAPATKGPIVPEKPLSKEEKAKLTEKIVAQIGKDNVDKEGQEMIEKAVNMSERWSKIVKDQEKAEKEEKKKAEKKDKKEGEKKEDKKRRLAGEEKQVEETPLQKAIKGAVEEAKNEFKILQDNYATDFSKVTQSNLATFKTDVKKVDELFKKAEAVLQLHADEAAKTSECNSKRRLAIGLGVGLGVGIPVVTAALFAFLVKTKRVLLNFNSTASVDV